MAFTSGNDVNILQGTDSAVVGAGAGNDKYILDSSQLTAGQTISISDASGANTLHLVGGLVITSSKVSANAIQLTLSNGAVVNVDGANTFTYLTGGNSLTAVGALSQTFSSFVVSSLGVASVPTGTTVSNGTANVTVNTNGTVAPVVTTPTFSIAAGAASVTEGQSATFTVSLSAAQAAATTVNYALTGTGGAAIGTDTGTVTATGTGVTLSGSTLTFAAGATTATITVPVTADAAAETGEGITVTLSSPSTGMSLGATAAASTTLADPAVSFILTSGTDNFSATSTPALTTGSEVISGAINTLTSSDSIVDPSTTDNDTLSVELVGNVDSTVKVTNVENLSFKPLSGVRTVDNTLMTGVKTIEHSGTGDLTLTNVQSAATKYKMTGTASNLSITPVASVVTGAGDTAAVTLSGTSAGTLTVVGGVEAVTLTSSGSAQNVLTNVVAAGATTLTIDGGAGFKNTTAFANNFTTIDTRSAGAIDLNATSVANLTVLAGSTADKVTLAGALIASELISLGTGTDTLQLSDSTGGAAAVFTGVENIKTTDAAATSINMSNADQKADIEIAAAATSVNITNLKAGSTVKGTTAAIVQGASSGVGFAASATGTTLNLDLQKGVTTGTGGWTFTNVGELTITAGAVTTFANTVLDESTDTTVATTKFTLANTSSGLLSIGNVTASSLVTDVTVTSSGSGTGGVTVGTFAEAEALTNLTLNASAGVVTVGNIGATASTKLNTITVNADKDAVLGTIGVANSGNIASVTLNATGGIISDTAGVANGTVSNIITNTGGNISAVTITGSKDVEIGLVTATSGKVGTVTSTNTGSTYIDITNATTTGAGTNVTLGNAASGSTNVLTLKSAGNHTITGGSGLDTLKLATTYDADGNVINLGNTTFYIDGNSSNTTASNIVSAGRIAAMASTTTVETASTTLTSNVSGIENITLTDKANIVIGSSTDNIITGGTGVDTIDGGAGNDTITTGGISGDSIRGGLGNDTITGGNTLADTILGGAGADTINVGTGANVDILGYDLSTDVATGTTLSNADIVSNFSNTTTGTDQFNIAGITLRSGSGVTLTTTAGAASDGTFTTAAVDLDAGAGVTLNSGNLVIRDTASSATTAAWGTQAAVDAYVNTLVANSANITSVANTKILIAVDGATANTFALFLFDEGSTLDAGIQAAELSLIGVYTGNTFATDVVAGIFI